MKVTLVTHWLSKMGGGISAAVEDASSALAACGLEVATLGLWDARWSEDGAHWTGSPVQAHRVIGPKAIGVSPGLRRALMARQSDVVHLHGLWMHPSADVLAWSRSGGRYLVSSHGMLDPWAVARSALKKRLVRKWYEDRMLQGAACLHALNYSEVQAMRAFGLKNPICTIPNGVSLPDLQQPAPPPPWAEKAAADGPVMLFLGRLHPKKNVHGLIEAMARVKAAGGLNGWTLAIAGWDQGGYGERLRKNAAECGLGREVIFLGALYGAERDAALRNASAFILPSFSEGLPMAVLEAWAHEKPVAMTPACNLEEGYEVGAALEIPTDPDALAANLKDLFALPAKKLREIGTRGREHAQARFSWPVVAKQFEGVYHWVLSGGPEPDCVSR
jgi:glycosyltransferase involved in cell wall biosynthesis